jgi:hypothetical protein
VSAFRMYLWKEWREQRAAVLALAIVLPALVLTISASMPRKFLGSATFTATIVVTALAATLVAIGGELLTADRRTRGQWLERLPGGLPAAFPAKLLVFGLSTVAALTFGFALGLAGTFLEGRDVLAKACASILASDALGGVVVAGLVLACWTFAASAWCPRGMIALCSGTLLVGVLGFPLWLYQREGYEPERWEPIAAVALLIVAALVSAWAGFVRGNSLGRTWRSSALRACTAGALCAIPLPVWGLHQLRERDELDLATARFADAWIFGNGKKALLEAYGWSDRWRDGHPGYVLLADIERGTWKQIGPRDAWFDLGWRKTPYEPSQDTDRAWIDGVGVESPIAMDAIDGRLLFGDEAVQEGPIRMLSDAGQGWSFTGQHGRGLIDTHRDTVEYCNELGIAESADIYIGPHGWLVRENDEWFEYSGEAGLQRLAWLSSVVEVGPMLSDGRLLVLSSEHCSWALADLKDGSVVPVHSEALPSTLHSSYDGGAFRPGEPLLLSADTGETFILDPDCLELEEADESYAGVVLRALADGSVLFWTDAGIVRRDATTGARTLVFDVASAREEEALEP